MTRNTPTGEPVVLTRGLTKRYRATTALRGVDLTVTTGQVFGFLGPNGAGKTTALKALVGLLRPTAGKVRVLGRPAGHPAALGRVGAMIEAPGFYPYLSGRANLRHLARYVHLDDTAVDRALELVELRDRSRDRFAEYSLGMKQRLGVAAALMKDPELVILDEPTNGLDPQGMRDMRALISGLGERGHTVILSSHQLREVQEVCDWVVVIDQGRVIHHGSVAEIRAQSELEVTVSPAERAIPVVRSVEGVSQVRVAGPHRLLVSVPQARTAGVNRALVEAGLEVTGLRWVERQLEDVFFDLTGQQSDAATEGAVHV